MEESGEEGKVKNHGRASGWATGAAACRDATSGWSRCSGSEGPKCVKGETAVWAPGGASADARGVGREGRAGPPAFSRGAWGDKAGEQGGPRRGDDGDDNDRRQHEHDAPLGAVAFRVTGEKPGNGVWTYARPQAEVPLPRPATQPSLTHRRHARRGLGGPGMGGRGGETTPAARRLRRARFPTGRGGWPVRAHTTATGLALLWLLIQRGLEKSLGPAVQTRPRTPGADAHPTRRGRRPAIGLVTRGCSAVTAPGHPPRGVRRRPGLRGPPAAPAPKLCRLSQGQPGKQGQPPRPQSGSRPAAPPGRPASLPGNDLGVHAKYWVTPGGSSIRSADVTVLRTSTGPSLPSKPRFFVWGDISLRKRSLNQRDAGCPVTAGNATKQPTFPKPLPTQNFPDC